MIDFISTHPNADPQSVACARLLAAIIAQAIEDASSKQSSGAEAAAATAWLFEEGTPFAKYAALIGANAQAMREAMLAPHQETGIDPKNSRFDESRRRRLRANYSAWLQRKELIRRLSEKKTNPDPKSGAGD
jgi:hypothetical protein